MSRITNAERLAILSNYRDDVNICLNFLTKRRKTKAPYLLDINQDFFSDEKKAAWFIYSIVTADIVTCSTLELKHKILLNTEIEAILVENPIEFQCDEPDLKNDNPNSLKVLWYGDLRDIFSLQKDIIRWQPKEIDIVLSSEAPKKLSKFIYNTDIVYLPKTYTPLGECSRAMKVLDCVRRGKFVIADELPYNYSQLVYSGSLDQGIDFYNKSDIYAWIQEKQETLKGTNKINADNFTKFYGTP